MICFQISIFEPLETTLNGVQKVKDELWFAFKLVSLNHWKQPDSAEQKSISVVICFQISIFEPLETTLSDLKLAEHWLWFAFKLVSLNHWKQLISCTAHSVTVVICFQISIFEPLETTCTEPSSSLIMLWFAFKLVSLNHWKQHGRNRARHVCGCDLLSN